MGGKGEVKRSSTAVCEFEWSIPEFASLSRENDCYCSPEFEVLGRSCYLLIYPNLLESSTSLRTQKDTLQYFDIGLRMKYSQKTPTVMEVSFAIRNADGTKDQERHDPYQILTSVSLYYRVVCYISRAELLERASELMPSNFITVVCSVRYSESIDGKSKSKTSKCAHCYRIVDATGISFHEKNCGKKLMKCPKCSDVVSLWSWSLHECQLRNYIGEESLCQDFKKMLSEGENHDLIIKIGDKEFRAHRDILSCRSGVFASMMKHDMEEKNSGVINVSDCDPQAMKVFLSYVYTGKVEMLDQSNMLGLYYIADKYDVQGLKEETVDYIKKSLSITNICDVIQLALKHSDGSLLECAKKYFKNNVLDILHTVEWQSFLKDNTAIGNELLIKSIEKLK